MTQRYQFRRILPIVQTVVAIIFGAWGLWQRNAILGHSWFGWNSTARFHVWPWPYKFAVISNIPAFLAGLLLSWPINNVWPGLSEPAQLLPCILFIPALWYWVGSRLDRKVAMANGASVSITKQLTLLLLFTLLCGVGALIPIGYVAYIPY